MAIAILEMAIAILEMAIAILKLKSYVNITWEFRLSRGWKSKGFPAADGHTDT